MAEKVPQTYANHTRLHPPFHFFVFPVLGLNVLFWIYHFARDPSLMCAWLVVLSVALFTAGLLIRNYALRVQDRVIRLEERLRLQAVLGEPLRSRINELTEGQLIGLRFASDAEVAPLVERALNSKLSSAEIKKSIINWRPDYWRV